MTEIVLPKRMRDEDKQGLADQLISLDEQVGFKVSARGWCYELEGFRLIDKDKFDRVEGLINKLRKEGYLPVDFTAEEEGRKFSGVEISPDYGPIEDMKQYLDAALYSEKYYTPNWWDGEEYYIQMIVEKIDLKTLFTSECKPHHIPIATSKGWSSILQRAEYARRFKEAEENGLKCVLLYCGDYDPDGVRISEFLRSNLRDLSYIHWEDGIEGYDPSDLIIERFGLNFDFIMANDLTWIDNLKTGSGGYIAKVVNGKIVQGKTKAGKPHPNFDMPYVQEYLKKVGVRKCEANALVIRPDQGRALCRKAIQGFLGEDALDRFQVKRQAVIDEVVDFRQRTGLDKAINAALKLIEDEE